MVLTVLAIMIIAGALVPLIQRDLRRAVRRARWRQNIRRLGAAAAAIRLAAVAPMLRDAMREAAAFEKTMTQVAATMRGER